MRAKKPERREIDGHTLPASHRCFVKKATALFLLVTFALFVPDSFAAKTYIIAVIGTGNMGSALGKRFAGVGHRIVYGSRDPSRDAVIELVEATGHGRGYGLHGSPWITRAFRLRAASFPNLEELDRQCAPK